MRTGCTRCIAPMLHDAIRWTATTHPWQRTRHAVACGIGCTPLHVPQQQQHRGGLLRRRSCMLAPFCSQARQHCSACRRADAQPLRHVGRHAKYSGCQCFFRRPAMPNTPTVCRPDTLPTHAWPQVVPRPAPSIHQVTRCAAGPALGLLLSRLGAARQRLLLRAQARRPK
jgi:hypothetical protein